MFAFIGIILLVAFSALLSHVVFYNDSVNCIIINTLCMVICGILLLIGEINQDNIEIRAEVLSHVVKDNKLYIGYKYDFEGIEEVGMLTSDKANLVNAPMTNIGVVAKLSIGFGDVINKSIEITNVTNYCKQ